MFNLRFYNHHHNERDMIKQKANQETAFTPVVSYIISRHVNYCRLSPCSKPRSRLALDKQEHLP